MNDAVRSRTICTGQAITLPGGGDVILIATPPKPCVTIVVHGVNDLAGCYERIERGLCTGLNERLDLSPTLPNGVGNPGFLQPASYSLPEDDGGKASNPDALYYRRKFSAAANGANSRSVVIPFYWGFREEEGQIIKDAPHGEWMDRNRNRLDKAGTKEGGQFANATTNLPDMWGEGFNGFPFGLIPLNLIGGERSHPLFSAAGRRYMVLAAMRLAMLIKIIRKRYPDDTINIVGHSQGTLLNLLAHAFLKDEKVRPADGVIMLNSPYSLYQPFNDKLQNWLGQQTTGARIATLNGILQFIAGSPHTVPALSSVALKNCQGYGAIGGSGWSGGPASHTTIDGEKVSFNERDNRGSIYLYFTPQDQVVGLSNVQGIGWRGVDDRVDGQPARTLLPNRFHQRIFTLRKRNGEREAIGKQVPPHVYPLLLKDEKTWEDSGLSWAAKTGRADLKQGAQVLLTAPLLPVPTEADFATDGVITAPGPESNSGVYQVMGNLDPIDARIGLSNDRSLRIKKAWNPKDPKRARGEMLEEAVAFKLGRDLASVQQARDERHEMSQRAYVFTARAMGDGQVLITRGETPYEAGLRLQGDEFQEPQSFHSGIPNNPEHSRRVLAYDVAIGSGESVDDVTFYAYLCRVADWRLSWKRTHAEINGQDNEDDFDLPDETVRELYRAEEPKNRELIDSTVTYRTSGVLPTVVGDKMPSLVASQTWSEYQRGKPIRTGGEI